MKENQQAFAVTATDLTSEIDRVRAAITKIGEAARPYPGREDLEPLQAMFRTKLNELQRQIAELTVEQTTLDRRHAACAAEGNREHEVQQYCRWELRVARSCSGC